MFCPNCRSEFRAGIETCPDCNVPLVASLPTESHDQAAWVEVAETADPSLVPVLRSALEAAGIPCVFEGEEAVGIFPLGLNDTHFSQSGIAARLMVPADRLAEARDVLDTAATSQGVADNDASAAPESASDPNDRG
jgi:Putative prokaryotic signal transducing protein